MFSIAVRAPAISTQAHSNLVKTANCRVHADKDTNLRQSASSYHINPDQPAVMTSASKSPSASRQQSAANASTSETPSTSITPLPPDVAAARKARMNADLINSLKSTCPPGETPYITGVGLYTHVEGPPPRAPLYPGEIPQSQPAFLPVQTPRDGKSRGSQSDEPVTKLWKELKVAVEEEQETARQIELGINVLMKRFGGLPPPKHSQSPVQYLQQQRDGVQGDAEAQASTTTSAANMNAPANGRSQSLAGVMASLTVGNKDVGKAGTEVERVMLPPTASTTGFYAPDPRRQGR